METRTEQQLPPTNQKGFIKQAWEFLKDVGTGTDLTRISVPAYFIMPRSILEVCARNYMDHIDILVKANEEPHAIDRFSGVMLYLLSVLNELVQVYQSGKKPFNPILGEVFECSAKCGSSVTRFVAEQVSHHPPVTAFHIANKEQGIIFDNCTTLGGAKFTGKEIHVSLDTMMTITFLKHGETYVVDRIPSLVFQLLRWSLELDGRMSMRCIETGMSCELKCKKKPILGGTIAKVSGYIMSGSTPRMKVTGQWNKTLELLDLKTGLKELFNMQDLHRLELAFYDDHESSSTNVWHDVVAYLEQGDWKMANAAKQRIEEEQRQLAKRRDLDQSPFQSRYFRPVGTQWIWKR